MKRTLCVIFSCLSITNELQGGEVAKPGSAGTWFRPQVITLTTDLNLEIDDVKASFFRRIQSTNSSQSKKVSFFNRTKFSFKAFHWVNVREYGHGRCDSIKWPLSKTKNQKTKKQETKKKGHEKARRWKREREREREGERERKRRSFDSCRLAEM